jgi:hypothetical protein
LLQKNCKNTSTEHGNALVAFEYDYFTSGGPFVPDTGIMLYVWYENTMLNKMIDTCSDTDMDIVHN